jgi:hypothetical protein
MNKRGNPKSGWNDPTLIRRTALRSSSFDQIVAQLRLLPDQYSSSLPLKEWVQKNKNEKYVPPELLKIWGFKLNEAAFTKRRKPSRS